MKTDYKEIKKFIDNCKFLAQDGVTPPDYKSIVQKIMQEAQAINTENIEPKKYDLAIGEKLVLKVYEEATPKELAEMINNNNGDIVEVDTADGLEEIFNLISFDNYAVITQEEIKEINKFL